jgi:transcriptional antiterminator NusG
MSNERGSNTPTPLRPHEVARLLGAAEEKASEENFEFKIGDAIKVADGPFNGFDGIVEEVFTDKKKLKVSVKIFGRITPLELDFSQVGKE